MLFDGINCISFQNCSLIVGSNLLDQICSTYNFSCTVNQTGTGSCTYSKAAATQDKFVWSGTDCLALTTVATQYIQVTGTNMSDTICQTHNANCTVIMKKLDAKKRSHHAVNIRLKVHVLSGKYVWYGWGCGIIKQLSKICEAVKGSPLTDSRKVSNLCRLQK